MQRDIEIKLPPNLAHDNDVVRKEVLRAGGVSVESDISEAVVIQRRRSIDARGRNPVVVIGATLYTGKDIPAPETRIIDSYRNVSSSDKQVIIVGAGPAGYFSALELIERGIKPIVFDRGKDVRARRRDLRAIQQFGEVNPHSNYCFGEGGAGTYSDGKLYTRSVKRGDVRKPLRLLVEHGAKPDILLDTHPHIGSNKLPGVVSAIRDTILQFGGEVHFDSHVTGFIIDADGLGHKRMRGVIVNNEKEYTADAVILATGHSARDVFYLCKQSGVAIEAKPLAMGVRVEHQQALIDEIQYRQSPRDEYLPASSYRLSAQIDNRGVYSFCMCPGGLIVPSATSPGELVVNGMSMSKRDSAYANSGIVVEISHEDLEPYSQHGEFSALEYQKDIEQSAFNAGINGSQKAPAQKLVDFVEGKLSDSLLPKTSYIPGLHSAPLNEVLPKPIANRLQRAFKEFGKKMRGYYTNDAIVVGVESRTSSPVKIPRKDDTLEHTEVERLFPCGEGAGYAGGIISAAMDGQRVAVAVSQMIG